MGKVVYWFLRRKTVKIVSEYIFFCFFYLSPTLSLFRVSMIYGQFSSLSEWTSFSLSMGRNVLNIGILLVLFEWKCYVITFSCLCYLYFSLKRLYDWNSADKAFHSKSIPVCTCIPVDIYKHEGLAIRQSGILYIQSGLIGKCISFFNFIQFFKRESILLVPSCTSYHFVTITKKFYF